MEERCVVVDGESCSSSWKGILLLITVVHFRGFIFGEEKHLPTVLLCMMRTQTPRYNFNNIFTLKLYMHLIGNK